MYTSFEKSLLVHCTLCPRQCGVNRVDGETGFCNSDAGFAVSSICVHKGEEPVISGEKGICNVFFPHCNLQCIYCQNHEISENISVLPLQTSLEAIVKRICAVLEQSEYIVGFVSPSHYIPQMMGIIRSLNALGKHPVIVYNTNGYDSVASLKMLEGLVDVYLPDFKYRDVMLAERYSQAADYPEVAGAAIKEMYRQKGSFLRLDDRGMAVSGMIIRHMILPGAVDKSIEVLRYISEELSARCHLSLMAQYFPTLQVEKHPILGSSITNEEYSQVVEAFHVMGFYKGWIQDLESNLNYRPDFKIKLPFKM